MRILLLLVISIVFVIFIMSFIALNTTWIDISAKDISNLIMWKNINVMSALILSSFIIAHAQYHLKLDGQSKKRMIQLLFGMFFGALIIGKLLLSYYRIVYIQNALTELSLMQEFKADNTFTDASRMYRMHGVEIEYYDIKKTKKRFEPTPTDILLKEQNDKVIEVMHSIPLYLVLAFFILTFFYWIGNLLANKSIKRKSNNHIKT